jgi:hypothetical protein|tara:strand:- start:137 stop:577 length:441 start_codon:yes stop_codon:yes gene_type:complete
MKVKGEEFLVDGYISTDNNVVTAAIFMTVVPGANGDFCLGAYYGYAGGGVNDGGFFSIDIENSIHQHINFDQFDGMHENNSFHHSILEALIKKLWLFVDENDEIMTLTEDGLSLERNDGIWISDYFDGDLLAEISDLWSISLRFSF